MFQNLNLFKVMIVLDKKSPSCSDQKKDGLILVKISLTRVIGSSNGRIRKKRDDDEQAPFFLSKQKRSSERQTQGPKVE